MKHSRLIGPTTSAALLAAAVVRELRRPKWRRRWHGELLGFIPYDLRRPTLKRVLRRLWAPRDKRVIVPTAFGVGWTVNAGRLARLLRRVR